MRTKFEPLIASLIALVFGIVVSLLIAGLLGDSPIRVFRVLIRGAFGSPTDLGYSLYYATPLLLTGLSVAWAFQAGLFNIGADGQMCLGGVALAACGILAHSWPWYFALPLATVAAALTGGAWGAIAGW